jgi:hypothetical protein
MPYNAAMNANHRLLSDPACVAVLSYLGTVGKMNERTEVSLQELTHELAAELSGYEGGARRCVIQLVDAGLAEADLFPTNVWVKISAEGAAVLES